jgi:hypothetical protein
MPAHTATTTPAVQAYPYAYDVELAELIQNKESQYVRAFYNVDVKKFIYVRG